MEDPQFGIAGIRIANIVLDYFYICLLIMCFILSLGNRPQGSKWGYTLAIIGFGIITIYMTVSLWVSSAIDIPLTCPPIDCGILACLQRHRQYCQS